ncbi:MAG TPA: MBL fold metallo-hydrolase, partial [Bacteroidia bacterium]|nr:MBL fold metallo-hydrolase [Bacteroidia bacterium]
MSATSVLFLNHSSVIIQCDGEYLLCDPWFEKPAFGSWLPTFPMFNHPVYIASLESKLSILISHGHDDHCDDDLLELFDKNTPIISSDFASPSVKNRVKKIGFNNYHAVSETGVQVGSFFVKSFRNEDISEDDAMYVIRTKDAVIIHCNDNWFPISEERVAEVKKEIAHVGEKNVIFMSQTNSAS